MPADPVRLSKFLSFVLRHQPDSIGLALDANGWANIDELIAKGNAAGTQFSREDLLHVVETSDKKRFSVSIDGVRIRAAQGHSVSVELGLLPQSAAAGAVSRDRNAVRAIDPGGRTEAARSSARASVSGRSHGAPRRQPSRQAGHLPGRRASHAHGWLQVLCCRQRCVADRSGAARVPDVGGPNAAAFAAKLTANRGQQSNLAPFFMVLNETLTKLLHQI